MYRRLILLPAALLLVGTGLPATALASPKAPVTGQSNDGVSLNGGFAATRALVDPAGRLVVEGTLVGSLTGPPGTVYTPIDLPVTLPVDRGASTGNCLMNDIAVGPADQQLAGYDVHVNRINLHVELDQGPGSRLRVPMCDFAAQLPDAAVDDAALANTITHLLAVRAARAS